jgi:hypothetical protein
MVMEGCLVFHHHVAEAQSEILKRSFFESEEEIAFSVMRQSRSGLLGCGRRSRRLRGCRLLGCRLLGGVCALK